MAAIPTAIPKPTVKRVSRKKAFAITLPTSWPLLVILVFQGVAAWLLLQNTAFQDEALYIYVGRQILQAWLGGPPLLTDYSYFLSGNPYVFPIIGGGLDMVGGLELARLFSTVCMLVATACGYYITKTLFNRASAIFAAIFFVCQGPVLFLTRLATYDPLCLCLVAVGTALAVNATQARRPWSILGIGPALALAFGAKYAALLFIPSVLFMLALGSLLKRGWISMLVRGTLGALSLAAAAVLAGWVVIHFDPGMLHALVATTTNRVVEQEYPRLGLVTEVVAMAGFSYVLGFVSLLFARKQHLWIALTFLGSALLVPGYHIYKAELISLDKHLAFSLFFMMPVAGYALASLSGFRKTLLSGRYWMAGLAICLILFQVGASQGRNLYARWPSTANLVVAMQSQVRTGGGHYLVGDQEVLSYSLEKDTYSWQWVGPYYFVYTDKQGNYYQGVPAYIHAINNGYFDLIELSFGATAAQDEMLAHAIEQSKKYVLTSKVPLADSYGSGYFWVWRKV
jgi:4-amino-4-deoxy-L-arabinose transferase-like glycosyltransferase